MDKEILSNLYQSKVQPHIEYATQEGSPHYKKDKITMENVQRRHLLYSESLKSLGLSTLEFHKKRADTIQVYKILHDKDKADKEKPQMAPYTTSRGIL